MTIADAPCFEDTALRHVRVHLGPRMRAARTLEGCARVVCEELHEQLHLVDGAAERSACALVRCFATRPLGALEPALGRYARMLPDVGPSPPRDLLCLTLLASAGDEPAWRSRHTSGRHRLVPLPSQAALDRMPMVAGIFRQFDVSLENGRPRRWGLSSGAPRVYDLFHVEDALGSPVIPDQDGFVRPHGIRTVIGFGGSLRLGDLFVVLLFTKALVPLVVAQRLRGLARDVTTSFFRFGADEVFDVPIGEAPAPESPARYQGRW